MGKEQCVQKKFAQQQDALFRESFGCGPLVALNAWSMLEKQGQMPPGGTTEHLLWTLQLMKVYGKTHTLCRLCGGVDAKILRKSVWEFIEALGDLEADVVSAGCI
jgi:hypothetical protein